MRTLSVERRTQGLLSAWRCLRDCVPPLFVIMITVLFFLFLLFLTFFLLLEGESLISYLLWSRMCVKYGG